MPPKSTKTSFPCTSCNSATFSTKAQLDTHRSNCVQTGTLNLPDGVIVISKGKDNKFFCQCDSGKCDPNGYLNIYNLRRHLTKYKGIWKVETSGSGVGSPPALQDSGSNTNSSLQETSNPIPLRPQVSSSRVSSPPLSFPPSPTLPTPPSPPAASI
ncbi:unnamed protein product [Somion occarium]|uniref:C2H2-type domain-containing protein n=1 Tax=Somion occarium TaxID=3059160 RepID=A0ABP1DMG6_9APHY